MKPITFGLATGLFIMTCFAPAIPGTALPYGNPARVYSLTDAFFMSGDAQAIGNTMLVSAAKAAEAVTPPAAPVDVTHLLKIGDDDYNISAAPSVSLEPTGTVLVRKIGYGSETRVSINTTSSGTYSSDGLASPYVQYPGITATRANNPAKRLPVLLLGGGNSWLATELPSAGSFVTFGPMKGGGHYITGRDSTCFFGRGYAGCS